LTPERWAAQLDELLAHDFKARQGGPVLMAELQRMGLGEQARAAELALARVLARPTRQTDAPLLGGELLAQLDARFGWSRDAGWRHTVTPDEAERLMLLLTELRQRRKHEDIQARKAPDWLHQQRLADRTQYRARPEPEPEPAPEPWPLPPGWHLLAPWLNRPRGAFSVRLFVVLTLAFALLARPLQTHAWWTWRSLVHSARAMHVLLWFTVVVATAWLVDMRWPDVLQLTTWVYLYLLAGYGVLRLVFKQRTMTQAAQAQAKAKPLTRWCAKPWRAWALLLLPLGLCALFVHGVVAAGVGLVALPYLALFVVRGSDGWRTRPGWMGLSVLAGACVLLAVLTDADAATLGMAHLPALAWLPFASGVLGRAVSVCQPRLGRHALWALLGLALVGVNVLQWSGQLAGQGAQAAPGWQASAALWWQAWWLNSMALAAGLLPWLLWANCGRYSAVFWINSLAMVIVLLFALNMADVVGVTGATGATAAIGAARAVAERAGVGAGAALPQLVSAVLALLWASGVQRGLDWLALKWVPRA
jgi:hypothetical protein